MFRPQKVRKSIAKTGSALDWDQFLPPEPNIYWRHRWAEYREKFGLPFSRGHMANLDSRGKGPARVEYGGRVAYLRDDLVEWLNKLGGVEEAGE